MQSHRNPASSVLSSVNLHYALIVCSETELGLEFGTKILSYDFHFLLLVDVANFPQGRLLLRC